MKSALNRILHYVRIHSGESDALARATHHGVQRNTHMNNVSVFCAQAALRIVRRTTIERIKMSTKTLRKRIALTSVVALAAGLLSVAPASATNTDYAFDLVPSGSYNQVAYTESNGVEYSTFTMTAGPTEKITLTAVDNDGYDFNSVAITGGTGTYTAASRGYKTGTVQYDTVPTPDVYRCYFSNVGTASGSSATAGVFGEKIEWDQISSPTGYEFDSGDWDVQGELCGEWISGTEVNAKVTIPATAAGSVSIVVSQYDSLQDVDVEQRITVLISPAGNTEYSVASTCFDADFEIGDCRGAGGDGYGYFANDGAIYSPAVSGNQVGKFEVQQSQSNGDYVDEAKAKSMEFSLAGPGSIRFWYQNYNSNTNTTRLTVDAGEDDYMSIRLQSDGTAGTSTLTGKIDGKVVKTWTIKFYGQAKTITMVPFMTIGHAGNETGSLDCDNSSLNDGASCTNGPDMDAAYAWVAKDANGVAIPEWELDQFGAYYYSSSNASVISDACENDTYEDGSGLYATGIWHNLCTFSTASLASSGQTANAVVTIFNNDGTTITASQALTVGGDVKTVTVAFDKASYVIGNTASVTLTAKDASGNPVWDGAEVLTSAGLVSNLNTAGSAALAASTTVVGGKATVKTFAPVVPGTWTVSGSDVNGAAVTASATITNANDARLASLITKINALSKLIKKIQKKIGVK